MYYGKTISTRRLYEGWLPRDGIKNQNFQEKKHWSMLAHRILAERILCDGKKGELSCSSLWGQGSLRGFRGSRFSGLAKQEKDIFRKYCGGFYNSIWLRLFRTYTLHLACYLHVYIPGWPGNCSFWCWFSPWVPAPAKLELNLSLSLRIVGTPWEILNKSNCVGKIEAWRRWESWGKRRWKGRIKLYCISFGWNEDDDLNSEKLIPFTIDFPVTFNLVCLCIPLYSSRRTKEKKLISQAVALVTVGEFY